VTREMSEHRVRKEVSGISAFRGLRGLSVIPDHKVRLDQRVLALRGLRDR